jgi:hypothetical protein
MYPEVSLIIEPLEAWLPFISLGDLSQDSIVEELRRRIPKRKCAKATTYIVVLIPLHVEKLIRVQLQLLVQSILSFFSSDANPF